MEQGFPEEKARMSWETFFATQSRVMALRSTCRRLAVGCVIVRDKRMIASGYNGSIRGDVHCLDVGCKVVDGHCVRAIHAEQNALLQCARFGISTEGADLYVTHLPCLQCTKSIIQAGIRRVYYEEVYRPDPYAAELFEFAGIPVEQVHSDLNSLLRALARQEHGQELPHIHK
ncbi:MAG: ComE operon protein 2 [Alicyclobacillus macrosporangiidus]|uniref:ComE operon protein 2 n=2 Tax=Alicyclobacillus macrosporangiidus TaxID=392015 RepID=UPI000691EEF1|nr:ComE operon protein 2 [Alicyclobacillus macrosporangiidus]MCL6599343.1 ComE operon protein 2 [Alicyclobacillus macrosporangiidus]